MSANQESESDFEFHVERVEDHLLNFCKVGNYKQVVYLFDKYYDNPGFDVNCRDYDGNTPIILAARQGHGSIIQEVLRYSPDISLDNKKGQTVMHLSTNAIRKMIFGSVSSCLKYSDRLFCNACWLGNAEVVERHLSKDQVKLDNSGGGGLTNLDGTSCYQLTVKNINLLENIAVQLKCPYKPAQVLQSLLSHTTNLSPVIDEHLLHIAATKVCKLAVEVVRVLLKRNNFDITDRDEYDFTPVHHAARSGNTAVLDLLLARLCAANGGSSGGSRVSGCGGGITAGIDCRGRAGNTALHLAATEGREECVRLLLQHGAGTDVQNCSNYTPLQLAKSVRIKNIFMALTSGAARSDRAVSRSHTSLSQQPQLVDPPSPSPSVSALLPSLRNSAQRLSSSVSFLDCLNEEQDHQNNHQTQSPTSPIAVDLLEPILAKNSPPLVTTAVARKKAPLSANSAVISTKSHQRILQKSARRLEPVPSRTARNKTKPTNHVPVTTGSQPIKPVPKKIGAKSTHNRRNDHTTEPEVIYESDFNTDSSGASSSLTEERETEGGGDKRRKDEEEAAENRNDEDDDDDDCLSHTMTEKLRTRTSDHIKWRRGEQLGKGSYGTVWKGMLEDGQYIAVKEIFVNDDDDNNETGGDSVNNNIREIRREIEILRTVHHRNIVKYLGACDSLTCIHIFMEFVSGGSIAQILSKFGGFSENIVRIYSRQIVTAVAFLHQRSVVHRDLKGANIMVTPRGIIKVVDFGCAKILESFSPHSRSLTQKSRLQGSVYWLAPEVINGGLHSHKSDIWSVGCIAIEMVTTKPPWSELHPYAAMFAIGTGRKPCLSLADYVAPGGERLSGEMCQFVELCLNRDVPARCTAAELLTCAFFQ